MLRIVLAAAAVLVLLVLGRFVIMSTTASAPDHLGSPGTSLAPCPDKPNCVSSLAERDSQRVKPLAVTGSADGAARSVVRALEAMPHCRIVTSGNGYVHAEFTSRLFRFVDDLELVYDDSVPGFQVRSASRVGHSDLGTNRKRVEALRARLTAAR